MKISYADNFFMNYAIRLASRNIGNTGKNPSVGCVLTSDNKIISFGITGNNGSPHAEYQAIKKVRKKLNKKSVILIAGKGHEDYQEINGEKMPFSDHNVVKKFYRK